MKEYIGTHYLGPEFNKLPEQYQEDIVALVNTMAFKLNKNRNKACEVMNPSGEGRGYDHLDPVYCIERAVEEADEASMALTEHDYAEVLNEAADVANFAMFLHAVTRKNYNL